MFKPQSIFANKKQKTRDQLIGAVDQEFINNVYADYSASKELKPTDLWQRYDDYVEDSQWDSPSAKDEWKPRPQVNICWQKLQTVHANMTSGTTSINVTCRTPYYDDVTQDVNSVIEYYWDALDMDSKINEGEWIRPKIGSLALKVTWNPRLNGGKGDLDTEIVHPANVFIDPNITNPNKVQQADFIDFVVPKTIKYVLNNYSKENNKLCKYTKAELEEILYPESSFSDTEIYGDAVTGVSGRTPTSIVGTDKTFRSLNHRDRVLLHEYWYRDDNEKLQVGWLAGQVLLRHSIDDDEMQKNGFYKHGRYPLVYIPYIQKDKRLHGRSEFQSLIGRDKKDGIQDIINKMLQDYLVNLKLVGQGRMKYRHGTIKDPTKLTGEAGLVVPIKGNPITDLIFEHGKPMSGLLNDVEAFMTHSDRITGLWDVTQGRSTPYTKTVGGTVALLEQAMKPQNDKISTLNFGLKEMAEIWLEHLAEFVTKDKEYYLNRDGEAKQFTFNPSKILKSPKRILDGEAEDGEKKYKEAPGETRRLYFNIRIDVGATLAITRAYLVELGMNLYQQKALDLQGLYKLLPEFPGKQDSLKRMVEMMAQAQQQPPGGQLPPGQPPEGQSPEGQQLPPEAIQFLQSLPPEVLKLLNTLPPEGLKDEVEMMMQMSPDELQLMIEKLMADEQGEENVS